MKDLKKPSEIASRGESFNPILERWRNRPAAGNSGTRSRRFRIIIIINIVLLGLMVVISYKTDSPAPSYSSLVIASGGSEYRFSVGYDTNTANPLLSLTVKNVTSADITIPPSSGLAVIDIRGADEVIVRKKFSFDGKKLVLGPGESKTFIEMIDHGILDEAEAPPVHSRGIFRFMPSQARTFTADCSVPSPDGVKTGSMTFTHEVRR